MECLGFLSLRTSQLGRGGRKVSPPSDRWLLLSFSWYAPALQWATSGTQVVWDTDSPQLFRCIVGGVWGHQTPQVTTRSHEQPCPFTPVCKYMSHGKLLSEGCVSTRWKGAQKREKNSSRLLPRAIFASLISSPWTSSPYGTSKVTLVSQSILFHVLLSSFHTLMSWLLSNEKIEPPLPSHSRCLQTP